MNRDSSHWQHCDECLIELHLLSLRCLTRCVSIFVLSLVPLALSHLIDSVRVQSGVDVVLAAERS